jgi:hypothetical protein
MADRKIVERLVALHKGWFEGDTARFPTVHNKQAFEKALALIYQREVCNHDYGPTGYGGLSNRVYECRICGELDERDIS